MPFLARAMSSDSRDSVQKALRILCDANSLPDFQAIWWVRLILSILYNAISFYWREDSQSAIKYSMFIYFRLGDLIASNNAAREEEMTLLRRPIETDLSPPSSPRHQVSINNSRNSTSLRSASLDHAPVQISAPVKNANRDANIESLIEKMKSGLEVSLLVLSFFSLTLLWHNIDSCTELPHGIHIIHLYFLRFSMLTFREPWKGCNGTSFWGTTLRQGKVSLKLISVLIQRLYMRSHFSRREKSLCLWNGDIQKGCSSFSVCTVCIVFECFLKFSVLLVAITFGFFPLV